MIDNVSHRSSSSDFTDAVNVELNVKLIPTRNLASHVRSVPKLGPRARALSRAKQKNVDLKLAW